MQLQPPTKPLGAGFSPSQPGTLQGLDDEEEEVEEGAGLIKLLSGLGLVAALVVLTLQLMAAGQWIGAEDNTRKGEWSQLME